MKAGEENKKLGKEENHLNSLKVNIQRIGTTIKNCSAGLLICKTIFKLFCKRKYSNIYFK